MAELHGGRIAAVLTADAQLDVGTGGAAFFSGHLHQSAYADLIQLGKGIGLVDLSVIVSIQEFAGVKMCIRDRPIPVLSTASSG